MKLQEYEFSRELRKDVGFVNFANDVTKIINTELTAKIQVISLTGQTADISATTIFTPDVAWNFRVSVYAVVTTAGSAGTMDVVIGWTDEVQAQTSVVVNDLSLTAAGNAAANTTFIRSTAAAITYTVTRTGVGGSPVYSLYLCLEQIG